MSELKLRPPRTICEMASSGRRQSGRPAMALFTTFYKPLRWLDTLLLGGLYSLALVRTTAPPGEDSNVQEMAIDGPHAHTPDTGAGHCDSGGSPNGFQHLEPEAHP